MQNDWARGEAVPLYILAICKGVVIVRFEKDFTSRHRLKEWLESKSWKFYSIESFYDWLEKFIDEGNILAVRGEYIDFQDCVDVLDNPEA